MCLVGPGMYAEVVSSYFYHHRVSQKYPILTLFVRQFDIYWKTGKLFDKDGQNQIFLDKFCFMNFALKLSAVKMVGNNISIHSSTNQTHFASSSLL
jgi:hypothetical protein